MFARMDADGSGAVSQVSRGAVRPASAAATAVSAVTRHRDAGRVRRLPRRALHAGTLPDTHDKGEGGRIEGGLTGKEPERKKGWMGGSVCVWRGGSTCSGSVEGAGLGIYSSKKSCLNLIVVL